MGRWFDPSRANTAQSHISNLISIKVMPEVTTAITAFTRGNSRFAPSRHGHTDQEILGARLELGQGTNGPGRR
jgi:hypothetical protein